MPPMSIRWAETPTQATSSPSTKIGCWTMTSWGCSPPPLCGSLARNTSPAGRRVSPIARDRRPHRVRRRAEVVQDHPGPDDQAALRRRAGSPSSPWTR